ncbi:beta-1,6-N-acetylglucosaminyltransferase [Rossellomorea marisflavi]|uniref:beta-1,6-N-acetylglucosaminyltransferase n=1 Tax=Rossellomorea marisflavi TaxID=189381 RepID=UPI003D2EC896
MAYAVQCHKNPNQVNLLINTLDCPNVDFFIHVDKKSEIIDKITKKENIHLIKKRYDVQWGGFSQVKASLEIFSEIRKNGNYDYVHLISGQDFPLKSNIDLINFFIENKGSQFIEFIDLPRHLYNRVEVYYPSFFTENGKNGTARGIYKRLVMLSKFLKRDLSKMPKIFKGSSWFSITGDCLNYILDFIKHDEIFYDFFKNTFCSDELFFQTILLNSPYSDRIVNNNYRYINWEEGAPSPKTLQFKDLPKLKNSNKLFGRKFDSDTELRS